MTGTNLFGMVARATSVLLCISAGLLSSAQTWTLQSPLPGTGEPLFDVEMVSTTEAFAVGSGAMILHTSDNGRTWERQNPNSLERLYSVAFFGTERGIAVGNASFYTTDGGATWQPINLNGVLGGIYNAQFVSANVAYVNTGSGGLMKSTDGGQSFVKITSNIPDVRDAYFLDEQKGFAIGSGPAGQILVTTNGGVTWQTRAIPAPGQLTGISFATPSIGWASGYDFILKTTDGGQTWVAQQPAPGTWSDALAAASPTRAYTCGVKQGVWATTDGATWQTQMGGLGSDHGYTNWLNSIDFIDANHGMSVGEGGSIFSTEDGGVTWQTRMSGTGKPLHGVFALDANHVWAGGRHGEMLWSDNGGAFWHRTRIHLDEGDMTGIGFIDLNRGWVACRGGDFRIYKTTDGGRSWSGAFSTQTDMTLEDLVITNGGNTIIAVGRDVAYGAPIVRSTNGGLTWDVARMQTSSLYDIELLPNGTLWTSGSGYVYKSTDNGATWQVARYDSDENFGQVSFADNLNGWLSSTFEAPLRTTDGGITWVRVSVPENFLESGYVTAITPNIAWLNGWDMAAKTTNGGLTWTIEPIEEGMFANSMFWLDADTGWIAGGRHAIAGPSALGRIYKRTASSTALAPGSFTIVQGTLASGGLGNIQTSDNSYLSVDPNYNVSRNTAPVQVMVQATTPARNPTAFAFDIESAANAGSLSQTVSLFNYATGTWEDLDTRSISTTDGTVTVTAGGNLSRFINQSNGEVRALMSYKQLEAGARWRVLLDFARWRIN